MDSYSTVVPPPIFEERDNSEEDNSEGAPAGDDYKCSATNILKTLQVLRYTPIVKK